MRNLVSRTARTAVFLLPWLVLAQNPPDVRQKAGALERQLQKYLQEQKPELATPVLREIVSLDAKNIDGQANLGVLLYFQGNYAESLPHLRAALELQPGLPRIEALLGIAGKRTGDPQEAHFNEQYLQLFRNDGKLNFTDVSNLSNITRATTRVVGWGDALYDFDND